MAAHRALQLTPITDGGTFRGFSWLVVLVALVSVRSPSVAHAMSPRSADPDSAKPVSVYVARRGWHIDVGFETSDLKPPLASLSAEFPAVQSVFFGFGDERYLRARNRNVPLLLAALWPGRGLILATGLMSTPQSAFGRTHVIALQLTAHQAQDMQDFIWLSLVKNRSDAAGPYEGSLYFSAKPRYSALYTCNTWAAHALAAAGLPIHSTGVLFAGQLWRQVRRIEKALSRAEPRRLRKQPLSTNQAAQRRSSSAEAGGRCC
jgi:hypothetical protein